MRLRWVVGGILVSLVVAVASVLVFANRLIEANRDRIMAAAESEIGRPVRLGSIGARIFGRPGVRLTDVSIADDPAFGDQPFITAREATVLVTLLPLLAGRLEISRIQLEQPMVRLLRRADGRFNYETIGRRPAASSPSDGAPPASGGGGGLALAVALFDIDEGAVDFVDRTADPPRTTVVRRIALRASDLTADQPIDFNLRAAVDSPSDNLELAGAIGPLSSREGVPFSVTGNLGPFPRLEARVEDIDARGRARPQSIDLDRLDFGIFGGKVSGQGTLPLVERAPLSFDGKATDLEVEPLLHALAPELNEEVGGRAALEFDLQGVEGTPEQLRNSLRGNVTVAVRDGVLLRYNLLREVVDRIGNLPGLASFLSAGLKPKYAAVLERPDTRFASLDVRLRLMPDEVHVESADLEGDDFGARVAGTVTIAGHANLQGEVLLSRRFSAEVVADVKQALLLVNRDGRVSVPFRYRGKIGQAKPEPDAERLATSVLGARGGALVDELQRHLGNLLRRR